MKKIEAYNFGNIVIEGGTQYNRDLLIIRDKVYQWWRKDGHNICLEDINLVLENKPEYFVIGIGAFGIVKVPDETIRQLEFNGINVIRHKTHKAVEVYNKLIDENKDAALGVHLTC